MNKEDTMKKSVVFLFIAMLSAILSGCIISKTPSTNSVTIPFGEQKTFSANVFPPNATYVWTLDGEPVSNSGKSYTYTALAGGHLLIVLATHSLGTDAHVWNVYGNSPPVANAGDDQTVAVDSTVTLDGSDSADPDSDIVSYQWSQIDGPTITLTDANIALAHFTVTVAVGSTLTFELTVTDATGLQAIDTCVITVSNPSDPISLLLSSMVSIPSGTFQMGSMESAAEWPVHEVTLQRFEIGAYEVTQAQ
jgi:hypothetical protein